MYRSILAVACAVLAVSCVKNPGSGDSGPGTDTPDVSHFQTAEQYTVPTKAGQITTVKMNGVTLAEASSPMKIWIPRYARTKAAAAPEVIYTPADEYPNGFAGNKAQLFQVVCFEDSRSGDYDYNDLVIHVKYQWNGTRFGFGVHPIALGSTKEVRLGAVVYKGSTRIFKGLLAPGNADARTQYFQSAGRLYQYRRRPADQPADRRAGDRLEPVPRLDLPLLGSLEDRGRRCGTRRVVHPGGRRRRAVCPLDRLPQPVVR